MGTLETSPADLPIRDGGVRERESHRVHFGVTCLALSVVVAATAALAQIGADARWLAALGQHIAAAQAIPDGLPYAAAPSLGWHNPGVLGELVFHALHAALSDRGFVLLQLAAVCFAFVILARDMHDAGAADAARGVVLVGTALAAAPAVLVVRAQLFSIALFPLLVLLLRADARRPSRRVWLVVPLLALWSNLHGGVLVGAALTAAYLLIHRLRRDWMLAVSVLIASCAALVATPAMFGTIDYYRQVLTSEVAARGLQAWAPLSFHAPFDVVFLIIAIPLCIAAVRARPKAWELAVLAALAAMSVHANRNTVWFALFAATPAARALRLPPARGRAFERLTLVAAGSIAIGAVAAFAQTPVQTAAGRPLLRETSAAARDKPVLADSLNAEELALAGQKIWIGNPLDAFGRGEQRRYLDWLEGRPYGDRQLTASTCAVLVTIGSAPEVRLARNGDYRELDRDAQAVLYHRASCTAR